MNSKKLTMKTNRCIKPLRIVPNFLKTLSSQPIIFDEVMERSDPISRFREQNNIKIAVKTKREVLKSEFYEHTSKNELILAPKEFSLKNELIEKIGRGMQGEVFKIRVKETNEIFAAKVYYTKDEEQIFLIKNEHKILSNLSHSHIIKFNSFYEDFDLGCYILVTEFFESIRLDEFLIKHKYDSHAAQYILSQIYDALIYLHEKKIIHRDFNIKNILINPETHLIKIIDFGLSKNHSPYEEVFSPQGNLKYRPPLFVEVFHNPIFNDVWNFFLVVLSLLMKVGISSKKAIIFLQDFKKKGFQYEFNEEILGVLKLVEKLIEQESNQEEIRYCEEITLKNFKCFVKC